MKNEFHTIYLHECTSCVSRKYPGAWNLTIIVASVFQLRATKIYVNARPTVIMETSGRRKSVVSPIALSRFGRITCSRRSESVVVGTASRAVRSRTLLLPVWNGRVTVSPFSPLVVFHQRPPVLRSRRSSVQQFSATIGVYVASACACACVYLKQKLGQRERKVRGQVLRYTKFTGVRVVFLGDFGSSSSLLCSNARFSSRGRDCGEWSLYRWNFEVDLEALACYRELTHVRKVILGVLFFQSLKWNLQFKYWGVINAYSESQILWSDVNFVSQMCVNSANV